MISKFFIPLDPAKRGKGGERREKEKGRGRRGEKRRKEREEDQRNLPNVLQRNSRP